MPARVQPEFKTRIRELAAQYRDAHPWQDNLGMLEGLGASLRYATLEGQDGAYDPEHNVVILSPRATPERMRFTLAHEISHALLLRDDDLLSDIHDAYEGDTLEDAIEVLCNVGAAAMLVRPAMLERALASGLRGASVPLLMNLAEVSASMAMVALSEATDSPAIVAMCSARARPRGSPRTAEELLGQLEHTHPDDLPRRRRELEVRFSTASRTMLYSLSAGTPIPADHPIQEALETGIPLEQDSHIPFRSGRKMPAWVSAYPERGRVFAVFLDREASPAAPGTLPRLEHSEG